jgi:hypothetical protein
MSGDVDLLDIAGMERNLVVSSNQIDLEEETPARELMSDQGCDGPDSGLEWYRGSALYSLRRDTNRCLSWALYEVRRTKNSQGGELCHPATFFFL